MQVVVIVLAALALITALLLFLIIYFFCENKNNEDDPELGLPQSSQEITQLSTLEPNTTYPQETSSVKVVGPTPTTRSKNAPLASTSSFTDNARPRWPRNFTRKQLAVATDDFASKNFLGEGGFGTVFKGFLSDGKPIAVKMLKPGSQQGDREFLNEIETTGGIHHQNLVSLVGYCLDGDNRFLVYEFVPNNSLRSHLHGKKASAMEWRIRMEIALDSAKGLEYLHDHCNPRIIHRDIKSENILLDHNFKPKVADFGLAKFFPDCVTHVTTMCKGTFGYLDPDYFRTRKLTAKSDVYSFGVLLWELITGRRCIEENTDITVWAKSGLYQVLKSGNFNSLADPKLRNKYDRGEMGRMVCRAAACVYKPPKRRPTIQQIVRVLEGDHLALERIWNWNYDMPQLESSDSSSGHYMDALDTLEQTDKKGKRPLENSSS